MGAKEWITVAFILVISAVAMLNVTEKSEPKMLQQKITMTSQTIDTLRSNANTYAGIVPTKDYNGINMASLKSSGIIDYTVNGAGATSTFTAPFDGEMKFALEPLAGNKKFKITVTNSSNSSMDATQLDQWQKNLEAYAKAGAGTATVITDGISLTFSN